MTALAGRTSPKSVVSDCQIIIIIIIHEFHRDTSLETKLQGR